MYKIEREINMHNLISIQLLFTHHIITSALSIVLVCNNNIFRAVLRVVGSMQVIQLIALFTYQMIGLVKRCGFKHFCQTRKHCTTQLQIYNYHWICEQNNCENKKLFSTMWINMPVMMMGMYFIFFLVMHFSAY